MNWLILTFVSLCLGGIGSSIHRYILRDEHVLSYSFLFTFLSSLFFIPILMAEPIVVPETTSAWILILATAILWWTTNVLGFMGVSKTESTLGKPLAASKVLVVVILSVIVLGETMNILRGAGTLLLVIGMLILSWKSGWLNHLREEGVQLILATAMIMGVITVLDKFNVGHMSPNLYGFLMYFIPAILLGVMATSKIPELKQTIKRKWKAILMVTTAYGGMYYFLLKAFQLADVNVVYPIYLLNGLITLGLSYFWLGEKTQFKQRFIGALVMIAGAILVTLGA